MGSPQPLSPQELLAWREAFEVDAVSWDLWTLKAMDLAFLKAYSKEKRAQDEREKAREDANKKLKGAI